MRNMANSKARDRPNNRIYGCAGVSIPVLFAQDAEIISTDTVAQRLDFPTVNFPANVPVLRQIEFVRLI